MGEGAELRKTNQSNLLRLPRFARNDNSSCLNHLIGVSF
jgi:hypothetical protein